MSAVSHSRHRLLCDTADSVCHVTQQTMSAVSHSRYCLPRGTADDVCHVTRQTMSTVRRSRQCLLRRTADNFWRVTQQTLSAVAQRGSVVSHKSFLYIDASRTPKGDRLPTRTLILMYGDFCVSRGLTPSQTGTRE